MLAYQIEGDFQEKLVMALVERTIKQIYSEAAQYLKNYETGQYELFCVDLDDVLIKVNNQRLKIIGMIDEGINRYLFCLKKKGIQGEEEMSFTASNFSKNLYNYV